MTSMPRTATDELPPITPINPLEPVFTPFGHAMLESARLQPGERVLDVGCGYATSTIEAAEQVAPAGHVTGVDVDDEVLQLARHRIAATGLEGTDLREADAQVYPFEAGAYDVLVSRFGMMFFADPPAAFDNLAAALRPGGRVAFVCWKDARLNEWASVPMAAIARRLGRLPDLGAPGAPGPFAFADEDRVTGLLEGSGFRDVTLETVIRPTRAAEDAARATEVMLLALQRLPQTRPWLAALSDAELGEVRDALRAAFIPYQGSHGVVLDGTAWLVRARTGRDGCRP